MTQLTSSPRVHTCLDGWIISGTGVLLRRAHRVIRRTPSKADASLGDRNRPRVVNDGWGLTTATYSRFSAATDRWLTEQNLDRVRFASRGEALRTFAAANAVQPAPALTLPALTRARDGEYVTEHKGVTFTIRRAPGAKSYVVTSVSGHAGVITPSPLYSLAHARWQIADRMYSQPDSPER